MLFYVVLLAMVALFLALRLYSVLGKRTGHEQQPLARSADDRALPVTLPRAPEPAQAAMPVMNRNIDPRAEQGLRAVIAGESGFDVAQFLNGAQAAYRMTLEAFWKGDEDALADLVEADVLGAFAEAIEQRRAAGQTLDNRLIRIESAKIVDAQVQGRDARITVRFDADIAAITRDADGNVIAGSLSDAVETHDVWTFARTLKSGDPNWKLIDTDEA
ncbi:MULTISPECIES: Tim44/TimA family putative adaptor protein [unclassified Sphingomonas]|uniref:Tim44/TimA family putative adaptor protein n=2 Tax=Sphingomonas TaxID=13687 RepID=UPI002864F9F3|nr:MULTISPECIES: Tim44/TimA family putative adaptor protein [unclassified Sphingomonas]MDR6113136.1 putative lipid-binding transport protein (Tim44 family) [Sphingomonas sp. SORGH_AS_0789]MDR6145727.1 putative lipid-binding transport protein (Tim44 family) [Sphingomonas sp. SORGH_AS_0870]MDR6149503.1 putative lipid-binding transport protein (Tim44 family) [Sphingomonas sp. SORGH_AS_0742]